VSTGGITGDRGQHELAGEGVAGEAIRLDRVDGAVVADLGNTTDDGEGGSDDHESQGQ
jgi:hypothetical protein